MNKEQDKIYNDFVSALEALESSGVINNKQVYGVMNVINKSTKKFVPLSLIKEFKEYFFEFYGKNGIHPIVGLNDKIFFKGLKQFLRIMTYRFEGDSVDRENLRDIIYELINKGE